MGVEEKSNREEEEERKGKERKAHARVVIMSFLIPMSSCPRLLLSRTQFFWTCSNPGKEPFLFGSILVDKAPYAIPQTEDPK
jgi:hypothetical protein